MSPLRQPHRLAEVERPELPRRYVARPARLVERAERIVDAFGRQTEGAEVHAEALAGLKIQVRPHRLFGIHVHALHEPARLVGAYRDEREIDRTEAAADVGEEDRIGRVAGKEDPRTADGDDEPAPQGTVS